MLCDAATAQAARVALAFEALAAGPGQGPGRPGAGVPPGAPADRAARPGAGAGGPGPRWSGGRTSGPGWTGPCGRLTADGDGRPGGAGAGPGGRGRGRQVAPGRRAGRPGGGRRGAGAGRGRGRGRAQHPLARLAGAVRPAARRSTAPTGRTAGAWCSSLLGPDPEHRDLAPLLNPVLALELPETAASAELSGQGRAGRTRDLLVRLLRAVVGDDADGAGDRGRPLARLGLDRAGAGPQPGAAAAAAGGGHPLPGRERDGRPTSSAWAAYRRLLRAPNLELLVLDRLSVDGGRGTWSASGSARPRSPRS